MEEMDLGAVAIESFVGSVYGAINGASSITSSVALRLEMRGARIALGGLSTALHDINDGSLNTIASDVGFSIGIGLFVQGALTGLDAYTGKLSSTILKSYAIDGGLKFGSKQLLSMSGILLGKNVWRNRGIFI